MFQVIRAVLELTIHSYQLTDADVIDMTNFITTEARHFLTPALVKAVDYCLSYMEEKQNADLPIR